LILVGSVGLYTALYAKSANVCGALEQAMRLYRLADDFRGQSSLLTKRNFLLLINGRAVIMSHIIATVEITTIVKTLSLRLPWDRYKQTHKAPMYTACILKLLTVTNTNPGTLYKYPGP